MEIIASSNSSLTDINVVFILYSIEEIKFHRSQTLGATVVTWEDYRILFVRLELRSLLIIDQIKGPGACSTVFFYMSAFV